MLELIQTSEYSNDLENESLESYFASLFVKIVSFIQTKYNLTSEHLKVQSNYSFEFEFAGRLREVESSQVVLNMLGSKESDESP